MSEPDDQVARLGWIAKLFACANAGLAVLATVLYAPIPGPVMDTVILIAPAVPPLIAGWLGARWARRRSAAWLLVVALAVALVAYAWASIDVAMTPGTLAPLLLVVVGAGQGLALFALLPLVWWLGRR